MHPGLASYIVVSAGYVLFLEVWVLEMKALQVFYQEWMPREE